MDCPLCGRLPRAYYTTILLSPHVEQRWVRQGCERCGLLTSSVFAEDRDHAKQMWRLIGVRHLCRCCKKPPHQHPDGKCLFEPTTYRALNPDAIIDMWNDDALAPWLNAYKAEVLYGDGAV